MFANFLLAKRLYRKEPSRTQTGVPKISISDVCSGMFRRYSPAVFRSLPRLLDGAHFNTTVCITNGVVAKWLRQWIANSPSRVRIPPTPLKDRTVKAVRSFFVGTSRRRVNFSESASCPRSMASGSCDSWIRCCWPLIESTNVRTHCECTASRRLRARRLLSVHRDPVGVES